MATITEIEINSGSKDVVAQTLSTSDDFTFRAGARQLIELENVTAGAINVTFVGDEAGTVSVPGLALDVDASLGYVVALAAGEKKALAPESISSYLTDSSSQPEINSDSAGVEIVIYKL